MKIRIIGHRNPTGGGIHMGKFVDSLKALSIVSDLVEEIDAGDVRAWRLAAVNSRPEDINIWFHTTTDRRDMQGRNIGWGIFEIDRLPDHFKQFFAMQDVVWVPSEWGKTALVANGFDAETVDVIHEGVDPRDFHPFLRDRWHGEREFRFLALGKYEDRKGYRQLLEAFAGSFGNNPAVSLIMKADHLMNSEEHRSNFQALVDSFGIYNVKVLTSRMDEATLCALYSSVDAFVAPSRAEGWGLPIIEAAACGLPIISTFYSGQTEFLRAIESSVLKIAHTMVPITDQTFLSMWLNGQTGPLTWAEPSVESIAENMKAVMANYAQYATQAYRNSQLIRASFSWDAAAAHALTALRRRKLLPSGLEVEF